MEDDMIWLALSHIFLSFLTLGVIDGPKKAMRT